MCGIVGKINFDSSPVDEAIIRRMCDLSAHRGPDDEGIYINGVVGLGMRRLSIIDVSGGKQPISNEDGTIWIVFNGEIYNFQELRKNLEKKGHIFVTRSDTEVVVHLYEEMGERCVTELNGMFAFAIWDLPRQRLVLARDRMGQKPLHYALTENGLIFASEIPPILEDPALERSVDLLALQQFLHMWYVPGPRTMFEGIQKLLPAHVMVCENGRVRSERYWNVDFSKKLDILEDEWMVRAEGLLEDAVRIRLMSEVPLGALLSGGIDSSIIVALMTRFSDRPVKTFSIGFDEDEYNEIPFARQVANHFGTEHYEDVVQPDAVEVLPKLVWHYGEPFGDESCIPTYYVSKMARQHVTVALSGDGGDESFGGYPRVAKHLSFSPLDSIRGLFAEQVKRILTSSAPFAAIVEVDLWRDFFRELAFRSVEIIDPMERYAHAWVVWKDEAYEPLTPTVRSLVKKRQVLAPFKAYKRDARGWDARDQLFYLDLMTYLPYDLQVKMDIASMAVSLEVRSPFLDYRLVEFAASMPAALKIVNGKTKVLLRKLAEPLVPSVVTTRGKQGFSMPIGKWLREDLRPMMADLLLDASARKRGFFQPDVVKAMINGHVSGEKDFGRNLWLLLNFEIWYRTFLEGQP